MPHGEIAMDARQASMLGLASWPLDDQGQPMAMVGFQVSELIGLPNYSNVTVGPAFCMAFAKNDQDSRRAAMRELADDVEAIAREQRQIILNIVRKQTA